MKYEIVLTDAFKKDLKLIKRRNKNIEKLNEVVDNLASGKELDAKYRNHPLVSNGKYKNCKECHIEPNWLLVYKINKNDLILLLIETGSHSDLFI